MLRIVLTLIGIIVALGLVVWIGLSISPKSFAPVPQRQPEIETIPLPVGLPRPVERFYRETYGDTVPVIKTAVVSGRGTMRPIPGGPKLPMRFRFTHVAGQDYRHYIENTFFGLPFFKVNEYYVDGNARMELPWGVFDNNPKLDQGGSLGMWAELIYWAPSVLLTDPNVRWEPVDDLTAWLIVPGAQEEERFLMRFDPNTSEIQHWEVMRYKNGEGEKIPWINGMWLDEGSPWIVFDTDEALFNVDVDVSVGTKGL